MKGKSEQQMGCDNKDHEKANFVDQPGDLVMFGLFFRLNAQFNEAFNYFFDNEPS